jgi:hypothetical protein
MKKFLFKAAAFVLLQLSIFVPFWHPEMPHDNNYLAATIEKHHRLQTTPSPRLILIGGSNLAFGINSDSLEQELGLPVVNMGLTANLGVRFMLNEAERKIGRGDIVILSLEHNILADAGSELTEAQILEVRPASMVFFRAAELKHLIDHYGLSIVGGVLRRSLLPGSQRELDDEKSVYKRQSFNPSGSFTGHYGKGSKRGPLQVLSIPKMSADIREKIQEFARHCRERNALCFYTCPPYPAAQLSRGQCEINENLAQLKEIPDLIVLDSPCDHAYPPELFYDTCYHLTEQGAYERTRTLALELRSLLNSRR